MFENKNFLLMNKVITLLFWVAVGANYALGLPAPIGPALALAGPLIFAAHIVEVLVFFVKYRTASKAVMPDAVQILIFGVFHFKPIIDKSKAA